MAFEDIEKLKEKLAKDPGSKLFVPLAEEYRKAEMFDEAIDVLKQGLEKQPSYMSARVALGKIYLEKGILEDARTEFEKVIKSIPDNLFAHKKLAEIYTELGDPGKAVKQYRTVIKLNPLDEEAIVHIESLTGSAEKESVSQGKPAARIGPIEEEISDVVDSKVKASGEDDIHEAVEESTAEEVNTDKADIFESEEIPADVPTGTPENFDEGFEEFKNAVQPEGRLHEETSQEVNEQMFYSSEDVKASEGIQSVAKIEDMESPVKNSLNDTLGGREEEEIDRDSELRRAEAYIEQSKFSEALTSYNQLIKQYPEDKRIIQKVEELKVYLKMIGKDKDELINKLQLFSNRLVQRKR